jgi:hypothetical protein
MSADIVVLGDPGDLTAPPGSPEWAAAVRLQLQGLIRDSRSNAEHLEWWVKAMEQSQGYRALSDSHGRPFASFEAFCNAKPPFGLGSTLDAINTTIADRRCAAQQLALTAEPLAPVDHPGTGRGNKTVYNVNRFDGNASDYLTRRIARDHPEILERMKAGEFPSVRAAALEAGIVRPTVQVPLDPERAARILARHFDVMALIDALARQAASL